jgi:hypothetical protein
MSAQISISQVNSLIPREGEGPLYQVKFEIPASTEAPLALFVFDVSDDAYSHPATLYDIEAFPESKAEAISAGLDGYRQSAVTQQYEELTKALDFINVTRRRLRHTMAELDLKGVDFAGTYEYTIPTS